MVSSNELNWEDIVSPLMSPDQYLDENKENREIIANYENYSPEEDSIENIIQIINEKQEKVKIFVMGASWCRDSKREVPCFIKIVEKMGEFMDLKILFGIKINRLRAKGDPYWSARPPEAVDPKFSLSAVPTFYIFNKEGKLLGKIIEHPKKASLEKDLIHILEKNL